jgi:uncharacterized repeat protein (TIGR03803 family)
MVRRLYAIVFTLILAGCSKGSGYLPLPLMSSPLSPDGTLDQTVQPLIGYKSLYSFKSGNDAGFPYAGLTVLNGTLYGTTYGGGGGYEWGTVFKVGLTGIEHVLYRFQAGNDGAHPYAGLTARNGTLYGTTYQGGRSGSGTVFKITPAGAERVIYSFKGGDDGQYPYGKLVAVNGELYGTTYQGGVYPGWGTIFKVSTSGVERVIYRFNAGNDGAHPFAGLTLLGGSLYGTTSQGGTTGSGTVFKVSTAGKERVLYGFKGGNDGQYPYARLLALNGALYGTTYQGGASSGWGTIFKVSASGTEKVLYRFKAGSDGAHPFYAGLVARNGALYGTTYQGGTDGAGTVFKVATTGASEHVVYSFKGGDNDGQYPYDGLIFVNGSLYGTTNVGGSSNAGTVFKVTP